MTSYVLIELDTSPPIIEIFAPRYVTRDSLNTITITSSEPLSNYQDIYALDSYGTRVNFTLQKISDVEYTGIIQFGDFQIGIIQLYARMKDDVDNFSNVISIPIEIKLSIAQATVDTNDENLSNILMDEIEPNIKLDSYSKENIDTNDYSKERIKIETYSKVDLDIKNYSKLDVKLKHQGG